jgi:osmotically-inducible protein OsmY
MRSDSEIKRDVEEELRWDPEVDATNIAVAVKDGVVTLIGFVRSYGDQYDAEVAAKRVADVVGVANDIQVRLPDADERPDPDIARPAVATIRIQLPLASAYIRVLVKDGQIRLEGEVERNHERARAEKAVRRLKGVKVVSNLIQLRPKVAPSEVKRKIEEALQRNADIDAKSITVDAYDGTVALTGTVRSWANVKRPNESPGRRRASGKWKPGSR